MRHWAGYLVEEVRTTGTLSIKLSLPVSVPFSHWLLKDKCSHSCFTGGKI